MVSFTFTLDRQQLLYGTQVVGLITVGAFAGANLRHFFAGLIPGLGGTLVANVLGCFALGFLVYESEYADVLSDEFSILAGTGFLSSFTTYSTFALETALATPVFGVLNVIANYCIGLIAVLLGRSLAARIGGEIDG